jgi:hypothetical protein
VREPGCSNHVSSTSTFSINSVHSAGGWKSQAYADELSASAQGLLDDSTRDYQALLDMLFAELALDLPGLFGPVGLTQLFPIPAATLRELIEALNDSALDETWGTIRRWVGLSGLE